MFAFADLFWFNYLWYKMVRLSRLSVLLLDTIVRRRPSFAFVHYCKKDYYIVDCE